MVESDVIHGWICGWPSLRWKVYQHRPRNVYCYQLHEEAVSSSSVFLSAVVCRSTVSLLENKPQKIKHKERPISLVLNIQTSTSGSPVSRRVDDGKDLRKDNQRMEDHGRNRQLSGKSAEDSDQQHGNWSKPQVQNGLGFTLPPRISAQLSRDSIVIWAFYN